MAVAAFFLFAVEGLERLLAQLKWASGGRWLAALATFVFAVNPTLWAQATQAEVYTMHAAFVAAILGATLAVGRSRDAWPLWPLALLLGLGLAHHLTTLFLIPGVILFLLLTRPDRLGLKGVFKASPWFLAPLLLYLYIPQRAPASPWLYPQLTPGHALQLFENTLAGNLRFILGIGYAQALGSVPLAQQLTTAAHLYLTHLTGIGLLLAGLGLLALILEGAWPLLGLTGLSFLLLQTFNLFYGIGDIATYYLPLYLILTLWLGFGLAYLVEGLTRITSPGWRRIWLALPLLILWIPITHGQTLLPHYLHQDRQQARARWETILQQPLAPQALLVSNDRDEMVPLIYLQQIEHRPPTCWASSPCWMTPPIGPT